MAAEGCFQSHGSKTRVPAQHIKGGIGSAASFLGNASQSSQADGVRRQFGCGGGRKLGAEADVLLSEIRECIRDFQKNASEAQGARDLAVGGGSRHREGISVAGDVGLPPRAPLGSLRRELVKLHGGLGWIGKSSGPVVFIAVALQDQTAACRDSNLCLVVGDALRRWRLGHSSHRNLRPLSGRFVLIQVDDLDILESQRIVQLACSPEG